MSGLIFGNYTVSLDEEGYPIALGKGNRGFTYEAKGRSGLRVVVKQILGTVTGLEKFRMQLPKLIGINHPHLAKVHDWGRAEDGIFLAMEFCEGQSLYRIVHASGPLAPERAFQIASQVASGVSAIAQSGLSHLEIKPQNIMVSGDPAAGPLECKLIDFGPEEQWSGAKSNLIGPPTLLAQFKGYIGAAHFVSPELILGKPGDGRSDVYSLGATIWYAVCGSPLYQGSRDSVLFHHVHDEPDWGRLPKMPQTACDLLKRMLSKDPDERPFNYKELAMELGNVAAAESLSLDTLRDARCNDLVKDRVIWTNSIGMGFQTCAELKNCYAGVDPVRVADFQTFVNETGHDASHGVISVGKDGLAVRGHSWNDPGFQQNEDHPVVGVNRHDAEAFCHWLTMLERKNGILTSEQLYRLPTDREWSVLVGYGKEEGETPAARDDDARNGSYLWGNDWPPPEGSGNFAGSEKNDSSWPSNRSVIGSLQTSWPRTSPVGSFRPNRNGFHDLAGNVWEWCRDPWGRGERDDDGVLRGASWYDASQDLLLTLRRYPHSPRLRSVTFGFRCVLDLGG